MSDSKKTIPVQNDEETQDAERPYAAYLSILGDDFFPDGTYHYSQAAEEIAKAQGWPLDRECALKDAMAAAINTGELPTCDRRTGGQKPKGEKLELFPLVRVRAVNKWLEECLMVDYRWKRSDKNDSVKPEPSTGWRLKAPERFNTLKLMIYDTIKKKFSQSDSVPRAREVLEEMKAMGLKDLYELTASEVKVYDENGDIKATTIANVSKMIDRMIDR